MATIKKQAQQVIKAAERIGATVKHHEADSGTIYIDVKYDCGDEDCFDAHEVRIRVSDHEDNQQRRFQGVYIDPYGYSVKGGIQVMYRELGLDLNNLPKVNKPTLESVCKENHMNVQLVKEWCNRFQASISDRDKRQSVADDFERTFGVSLMKFFLHY